MPVDNENPYVIRSMLFVPGHRADLAHKAAVSRADCVVLDLQDSVLAEIKGQARVSTREILESGLLQHKLTMVRINPWSSSLTRSDIQAVACESLDGFLYAMTGTPQDIAALDMELGLREADLELEHGHFVIIPAVETPEGVIHAYSIAKSSKRVIALFFGAEDYLNELQGRQDAEQRVLQTPRAMIAMAARAAGVESLDTPYLDLYDTEGLKDHARRARDLGMSGMALLTPRQIPVAHEIYTPSEEEVRDATCVVEIADGARRRSSAVAVLDGKFVDPARERQARRLLARAAVIKNRGLT